MRREGGREGRKGGVKEEGRGGGRWKGGREVLYCTCKLTHQWSTYSPCALTVLALSAKDRTGTISPACCKACKIN